MEKMVLVWRDKGKPTIMISSVHQVTMIRVNGRRREIREKPLVIERYNQTMGGVDKADQYSEYYSF